MDLRTYQNQAIVTNKWLNTDPFYKNLLEEKQRIKIWVTVPEAPIFMCNMDLLHMAVGLSSEIDELIEAVEAKDRVGVQEELGDVMWYTVNGASMFNVPIQAQGDVGDYSWVHLVKSVSKLNDFIKKFTIYNKEIDKAQLEARFQQIIEICYNFNFSGNYAKINLPQALDMNIKKLQKVRYKLGYSDEAAQVRDVTAERKELETNQLEIKDDGPRDN